MARVVENIVTQGITGKLGNVSFVYVPKSRMTILRVPAVDAPTAEQLVQRQRFTNAAQYASLFKEHDDYRTYQTKCRAVRNLYLLALKDALNKPKIKSVLHVVDESFNGIADGSTSKYEVFFKYEIPSVVEVDIEVWERKEGDGSIADVTSRFGYEIERLGDGRWVVRFTSGFGGYGVGEQAFYLKIVSMNRPGNVAVDGGVGAGRNFLLRVAMPMEPMVMMGKVVDFGDVWV